MVKSPSNLFGVLHRNVGKQIQHRGRAVTILSVHQNTRLVVSVGEEWHRAFWIPRRAENRRDFKERRIKRLYSRGIKSVFLSPCYTGESRPDKDIASLPQWENVISQESYDFAKHVCRLSKVELLPKSSWSGLPWALRGQRLTRQARKLLEQKTREKYAALRKKLQERLLRQIIADTRLSDDKQFAVYDVMALGQPIEQVATARKLSANSLENTVRRLATKVNQAYQATLRQHGDNPIRP